MNKNIDIDMLLEALYDADAISARGAKIIREFPAVDVASVVRCGECKYWSESPMIRTIGNCIIMPMRATPEFFCAYGERKDGDGE